MPGGAAALEGEMDGVTVGKMDVSDPVSCSLCASRTRRGLVGGWSREIVELMSACFVWWMQNKPILQVAHHRLEGKLVKLAEPYALLRTTPASEGEENDGEGRGNGEDHVGSRTPKRLRLSYPPEEGGRGPTSSSEKMREEKMDQPPKIDIVGLVRRKIVFSKRPEPIITLSSDIDGMHEE